MSAATDTPASDLERRKQVKLLLRRDLQITPQRYEGRAYFVVKDPVSLRYYRFKEQEQFLIGLMDGAHTLDDAQKAFEKRFRPERLTLEDLEQFGQQLLNAGLVQNESPQAGKQLFDRRAKRRRSELLQMFTNVLYIKIPVFDPDKLLGKMVPWIGWVFTKTFLALSVTFMLAAIFLVLSHFETFMSRLPSYHEFFSFKTVMYLWAALGIVKVIHEFGHGLSCKHFGGEVHEMGFLILCFSPAMYCNVSDAWTMPSKWRRIIISFAGIYVELMIAALATFIWWNTPHVPFINNLSLSLMIVCSVSTVVFNGNPLMRYDGYYVLSDWLEIPNLRERSNRYISRLAMEYGLGIEVLPEPYMERWRRILFVSYAVLSYVYRWVVTFVILRFMATFLKPYKLEIISQMLTAVALGSMIGWPLVRLIKNINKRGRLPDMKPRNVLISSSIVALLLLGFFFVPLPVTRIRQPGLVQIQPLEVMPVYVETPGALVRINVKEGDEVVKNQIIAEFSDPDLETAKEKATTTIEIKRKLVALCDTQLSGISDKKERAALEKTRLDAANDLYAAQTDLDTILKNMAPLTMRAARSGTVMNVPKIDEIGKRYEKDQKTPFCSIGNPKKLRILVPVTTGDYNLLIEDLKRRAKAGSHNPLEVTIRVHGHGGETWKGRIAEKDMPHAEEKQVPLALSTKGGGPIAVKPTGDPNHLQPQAQIFLVPIDFIDDLDIIAPGSMGQVKIHCEYRSAAWGVWRWISSTFDLGLAF
ncbi:MAG: biotin/lipoyl-binding protein [Gemmataceae bacterium]